MRAAQLYSHIWRTMPDGSEREIECTFKLHPGCRGSRDRLGVPLEPDEEPEIELIDAGFVDNQEEVELTDDELTEAEEKATR